ncbi:MAG: type III-A CRISPR-associated protein Cas10/Csm1, partial [bacterium]
AITFKGKSEDSKYLTSKSAFKHKHEVADVGNYLFDQRELTDDDADFRYISSFDVSRVTRINTTDFIVPLKGNRVSYGFRFYGGNKQAQLQDGSRNKTFEEITRQTPENKESDTYFAVLRMDVDGLGDVFINGLKEKDKSFSAYATLSFLLDLFFSGYLNHIRNDFQDESGNLKYKDWVNILYSGGDDVFAVGRWDKIIDFAEDIRKEFARFTGREDISISAGITITGNKYPIAKAANMAGEAEDNAKKNEVNGSKNAICMFGEVVSWSQEFDYVKELKDEFLSLIANQKMAKGILHKLMQFSALKKDNKDLSYKWHSVYYLKRFKDRYHENPSIRKFVDKLQKELFEPRKYDLIGLSARWAELYVREILNVEPETK